MESYIMEQETRLLQDLESAVFNEFRKDVRKKLRRHSRSGRSGLPKITESERANLHRKKAMSEKIRGSRTRSRVRREASSDPEEVESEMVEMGSNSSTPQKSRKYSTSDSPVIICEDDTENAIFGNRSPSLPDVLNVGISASKVTHEEPLPLRSPSHQDGEGASGHRVTFRTASESDCDSVSSQKSVAIQQQQQQQQQQQNLDFELDVAVDIDSGKCVFYPADEGDKEETADSKLVVIRRLFCDVLDNQLLLKELRHC